MQHVIVKDDERGRRWYYGETGWANPSHHGLSWLRNPDHAWVYDTRGQAEYLLKTASSCGRRKTWKDVFKGAKIIAYRDLVAARKQGAHDEPSLFV